ncbi:uncharacterized protein [Argopecten irradians]|uniref:uncharacterized protein n=1 Tax=Argopecten irradians TaxID=31199 RepID=UPI00371FB0CA
MKRNIQPGDVEWISKCLYDSAGHLKETFPCQNWYLPPHPRSPTGSAPLPHNYFRQRMFLWAPMRMWHIPLKCPSCRHPLSHSGIYPKVREVIDMDTRYYLVGGDYPKCNKCKVPYCPWNPDLLSQLDPSHRSIFPAVLTKYNALDRKIVTMMKPRTQGNSSSYIQQSVHELHSEEWGRCCLLYMADCELHKKGAMITGAATTYQQPPPFRPLPLAQWFQTAHSHEILDHVEEMKGVITSTYGRVLKLDSTKKVTKKLAGDVSESASWMTNIANEHGQVLNSVLTTGEGPALIRLCQGIVQRYNNAGEPEPDIIYVDRDCCSQSGKNPVLDWFKPWTCTIRLDIFHFMRRFTRGLTTEHHPLYGTFCSKLSNCIFAWDEQDYKLLKEAKTAELKRKYRGVSPSDYQTTSSISSAELARHCKRRTKPIADIKQSINMLLDELWDRTDSTGLRLINEDSMRRVWSIQEKHLECIQDPPGVELYTVKGTLEKGGKILNVYKCARGSSSLESFHKHQCTFVPGWNANASHMQMYMMEGSSRWNQNRARDAVELPSTSATKMYDVRLMSAINAISQRVLNIDLIPEFQPPGRPTDELIAVDFLLAQSGKGDHRPSETFDKDDEKRFLPELDVEEATEEVEFDCTVSSAVDIEHLPDTPKVPSSQGPVHMSLCDRCGVCLNTGEMVTHAITCTSTVQKIRDSPSPDMQISEEEEDSFLNTRHDAHGFPGWEKVDTLSAYLVDQLDTTATSLTVSESNQIIRMYAGLHQIDKSPTKYARKSKKEVLPGPWRASRKRSGSSPGVQASERLYKTHGRAAQSPDTNRISECICIRLWRIYQYVRNRPKDAAGKTLQVSHAIVKHYSLIQQLLEDCHAIQDNTNLVLVTLNNTTVNAWMQRRQKRADRDALLKGTDLPALSVSKRPIPKRSKPTTQRQPGHNILTFNEPDNREGQLSKRPRKRIAAPAIRPAMLPASAIRPAMLPAAVIPPAMLPAPAIQPPVLPAAAQPQIAQWPPMIWQLPSQQTVPVVSSNFTRQQQWRQRQTAIEDQERMERGEPPVKRHKTLHRYICKACGKEKTSQTGHTQTKGKWYCPSMGMSVEEWRGQLKK